MKRKRGILWIGTSNIVVPGTKASFPPGFQHKSRLNYYSSIFNSLEINSTFYKVPMASTFEKWSMDVPADFTFTIKLWREVTHVKNLETDLDRIAAFLKAADQVRKKKGCLLVQFPGKITLEHFNEVEQILQAISKADPKNTWRKAIEFRNASWYTGETFELLDEYNVALVLHDIPKGRNGDTTKKVRFVYIRFHGPKGDYRGSYSAEILEEHAKKIKAWLKEGKDVYAYFNNTMGSAFDNAMALKKMVSAR